ncbi:MAG TPA: hypothetical protein VNP03_10685 [Pseudonocardia sp.]|nr:hypothetical protein [Pseudonocardia sp.]
MVARSARRQEQLTLARELRARGKPVRAVAELLREQYGVNARVAMRLAHSWGQADVATEWNRRWPDEPKTFKNISYWENWPSRTGYAPSLTVLDRLAQLYGCDVTDLLTGWGEHRHRDPVAGANAEPAGPIPGTTSAALAWHLDNLDLPELTRAIADWSPQLPARRRRSLLLKLSTAAAMAAQGSAERPPTPVLGAAPSLDELAGLWDSRYTFSSTGRGVELTHTYQIGLRIERGKLIGRSLPTELGILELELAAAGLLITGSWTEHTSPTGYYRGAVYHGVLQLVLDPTGRSMTGQWLGPDRHFAINAGPWTLHRSPAVPTKGS